MARHVAYELAQHFFNRDPFEMEHGDEQVICNGRMTEWHKNGAVLARLDSAGCVSIFFTDETMFKQNRITFSTIMARLKMRSTIKDYEVVNERFAGFVLLGDVA